MEAKDQLPEDFVNEFIHHIGWLKDLTTSEKEYLKLILDTLETVIAGHNVNKDRKQKFIANTFLQVLADLDELKEEEKEIIGEMQNIATKNQLSSRQSGTGESENFVLKMFDKVDQLALNSTLGIAALIIDEGGWSAGRRDEDNVT
uniref:Uncharacterized protein n=1 Tax=Ditylenchus dipsaci TaxID=166011 RepID=A0A915DAC5_9BILA